MTKDCSGCKRPFTYSLRRCRCCGLDWCRECFRDHLEEREDWKAFKGQEVGQYRRSE